MWPRILRARPLATILLASLAFLACSSEGVHPRYSRVVVVTFDTLNVEFTSLFDPTVDTTPELASFARQGLLFEQAHTPVPLTLPAHTSLFTGTAPLDNGVMANGDTVPESLTTLAEVLREAGYRTAAFPSLGVLGRQFGLDQGFETYDDRFAHPRPYRYGDEVLDLAESWIAEQGDRPIFLWVHLSDPHEPYRRRHSPPDLALDLEGAPLGTWDLASKEHFSVVFPLPPGEHQVTFRALPPPQPTASYLVLELLVPENLAPWTGAVPPPGPGEEIRLEPSWSLVLSNPGDEAVEVDLIFRGRRLGQSKAEAITEYRHEVAFVDQQLGRLSRALGDSSKTLWVLTSDHGEALYRLGMVGHAPFVYQDQLRTLFLLRGPAIPAGRRITDRSALSADLTPTLLDLLELASPPGITGRSLRPCWEKPSECPPSDEWWSYGLSPTQPEEIVGLAGYRWPVKVLWQDYANIRRRQTVDLTRSPDELAGGDGGSDGEVLERRLERQLVRHRRALDERAKEELTDEQRDLLRSLGYL
ncbi:MAG: sulfatase-like hydrolase/transferase [Acidobacteriota bacterium]